MSPPQNRPGSLPRPGAGVPVDFAPPEAPSQAPSQPPRALSGKRLVLCVTGSIAAYKSVFLLRLLLKQGAHVQVVVTAAAQQFVQASTFAALTGEPTHSDMFGEAGEPHVQLASNADAILVAPATADTLARLAHGLASDLVSALLLTARCPVLIAPAMHPTMWEHPRTQHNALILASQPNLWRVGPVAGEVASGEYGMGRMSEPEDILEALIDCLTPHDLEGRHVVVSAGPTRESLDPVRYLSNRSSGKMGFAVAARAAQRGARVTLVAGPVELRTPRGVERVNVLSAQEMQEALVSALGAQLSNADALVMAAAVSDFRVAEPSEEKIKRSDQTLTLELLPNPDLLASIGSLRKGKAPVLVGFALETAQRSELIALARSKLINKKVDLVVANTSDALEREESHALLVSVRDCTDLGAMEKSRLADHILSWVAAKLGEVESGEATE